jgi:hypothetical protein
VAANPAISLVEAIRLAPILVTYAAAGNSELFRSIGAIAAEN